MSTTPGRVFASKWGPCQTETHTENFTDENIFIVILGNGEEWQRSGKKIDLEFILILLNIDIRRMVAYVFRPILCMALIFQTKSLTGV